MFTISWYLVLKILWNEECSIFIFLHYLVYVLFLVPAVGTQIPSWFGGESTGPTKDNPFTLPDAYMRSQLKNVCTVLIE